MGCTLSRPLAWLGNEYNTLETKSRIGDTKPFELYLNSKRPKKRVYGICGAPRLLKSNAARSTINTVDSNEELIDEASGLVGSHLLTLKGIIRKIVFQKNYKKSCGFYGYINIA